jgi:hypothetical protein
MKKMKRVLKFCFFCWFKYFWNEKITFLSWQETTVFDGSIEVNFYQIYLSYGSPALRVQILNIWKMRNLSIWLVDFFLIWPTKSAYSAIKGFDWVLISCVVCIIHIFRICTLRAGHPYTVFNSAFYIFHEWWFHQFSLLNQFKFDTAFISITIEFVWLEIWTVKIVCRILPRSPSDIVNRLIIECKNNL